MTNDRSQTDFDRTLHAACRRCGVPLCVGIDPVVERMPQPLAERAPAEAFEAFSRGVVEAVSPHAAAVKFQSACFERLGAAGMTSLEQGLAAARDAGLAVVLDAKRGDIGVSARHYAAAAVSLGAQAITVNPYLGMETIEPYVEAGLAVFVLVRTSNPGSVDLQDVPVRAGGTLAMHVGRLVAEFGRTRPGVHAVVGATQHAQAGVLRAVMPDQLFLLPGLGAQGATVADLGAFARPAEHRDADGESVDDPTRGLLPTASRSVIYPELDTTDATAWRDGVSRAAAALNLELREAPLAPSTMST